jgi:hypothetical protein
MRTRSIVLQLGGEGQATPLVGCVWGGGGVVRTRTFFFPLPRPFCCCVWCCRSSSFCCWCLLVVAIVGGVVFCLVEKYYIECRQQPFYTLVWNFCMPSSESSMVVTLVRQAPSLVLISCHCSSSKVRCRARLQKWVRERRRGSVRKHGDLPSQRYHQTIISTPTCIPLHANTPLFIPTIPTTIPTQKHTDVHTHRRTRTHTHTHVVHQCTYVT